MTNSGLTKFAFYVLDRITDNYPEFCQKIFQKAFLGVMGSLFIYSKMLKKFQRQLSTVKSFEKILFIADVNIGDAIIVQSGIVALRKIFPNSRIDYICNQKGGEMVKFIPEADEVFNVVKGKTKPSKEDVHKIKEIIKSNDYTLILNMSPFLSDDVFNKKLKVLHIYILFGFYIAYLWKNESKQMHITSATYNFINNLFSKRKLSERNTYNENNINKNFIGKIYIPEKDLISAKEFLNKNGLNGENHILLFNTDATTKYCIIPKDLQIQIIKKTVVSVNIDKILISFGPNEKDMIEAIQKEISSEHQQKILYVPFLPIPVYAALIDFCDMFLSGDTGLVHLAASSRTPIFSGYSLRNSTSVVTLFGATDSRMYGYDFERKNHLMGGQFSISKVFSGNSLCRNITCTNKTGKTCKEVRCFNGISPDEVSDFINSYFEFLRIPEKLLEQKVLV